MSPVDWDAEEEEHYRELADRIVENHDGKTIEWRLQWPKWRFVDWLSRQGRFIFHGSPLPDVDTFLSRRNSVELMDQGGLETGPRSMEHRMDCGPCGSR